MGYTFTFSDIEKICRSLGMERRKSSSIWRGIGPDGKFRQTAIHYHGRGDVVAKGTAKAIAQQLGFKDPEEMYEYLRHL